MKKISTLSFTFAAGLCGTALALDSCWVQYPNHTAPLHQYGYWGKGTLIGCEDIPWNHQSGAAVKRQNGLMQPADEPPPICQEPLANDEGVGVPAEPSTDEDDDGDDEEEGDDEESDYTITTQIDVSDKLIETYLFKIEGYGDTYPLAFQKIWDRALSEGCTSFGCDPSIRICEPAVWPPGDNAPQVCATVNGFFANPTIREHFGTLLRSGFDAGVVKEEQGTQSPSLVFHRGPSRLEAVTVHDDFVGGSMSIKFELVDQANESCPNTVENMMQALGSIPIIGEIFGILSIACKN